jgi:hypothetical protein
MLILDNPLTWPNHIVEQLNDELVIQLCKSHNFMEDIANDPLLIDIFADVKSHAINDGLAGYHCTKQLKTSKFTSTGLRTLNFHEHHTWFRNLIRQHPDVDNELYQHIVTQLTDWQENHTGRRENMIWFCFTRTLASSSGTKSLRKYFGGEAVYSAFMHDERVAPILESMGDPVVVEAKIDISDLTIFREWALGRTLVSHFASSLNSKFSIEELEGYVSTDILPSSIVATHPHDHFVSSLTSLENST